MSSQPEFLGENIEDAGSAKDGVLAMRPILQRILNNEKKRITEEVEFLKDVHDGLTGGAKIEAGSTIFVDTFLQETLRDLLGVE